MRSALIFCAFAVLASPVLDAQSVNGKSGKWQAELRWRPRQDGSRVLWIMFDGRNGRQDDGGDFGFSKKVSELSGLAANDSRWSGPATFEFRRDAGVIRFNGRFEEGWGEGTYRFEGDSRFLKALDLANVEDIDEDELLAMVVHDVRTDWVRGLQQAGVTQHRRRGAARDADPRRDARVRPGAQRAGLPEPAGRQADRAPGPRRHAGVHPRHALARAWSRPTSTT